MTIPRNLGTLAQAAGNATGAAPQLNLGVNATTLGSILMYGNTSGSVTIQPPAVAGTATVITLPSATGTVLSTAQTATITKGFTVSPNAIATGNFTVDPTLGNYQYVTNNGAFTITNPASDCAVDILMTNGATPGSVTFSGFTVGTNTGSSLTTTYASTSSVTVTSASPGVVTWTSHGLNANQPVYFTAATMPTGLTANTLYYVASVLTANTFTVSATPGGTAINTSSTGTTVVGYAASMFIISFRRIRGTSTYSIYALQ